METPPRTHSMLALRGKRAPTPKMSDRKKSLFADGDQKRRTGGIAEGDCDLGPMSPLHFSNSPKCRTPMKSLSSITSFRNMFGNRSPESDRSLSPDYEKRFTNCGRYEIITAANDKENHFQDEETRFSFQGATPTACRRTPKESALLDETNSNSLSMLMNNDLNLFDKGRDSLKTPGVQQNKGNQQADGHRVNSRKSSQSSTIGNIRDALTPQPVFLTGDAHGGKRSDDQGCKRAGEKVRTSLFHELQPISTKSFYSSNAEPSVRTEKTPPTKHSPVLVPQRHPTRAKTPSRRSVGPVRKRTSLSAKGPTLGGHNRGVFHKIRKPSAIKKPTKATVAIKKLDSTAITDQLAQIMPPSEEQEFARKLRRVTQILRNSSNQSQRARPLSLSKSMMDLRTPAHENDDDAEPYYSDDDDLQKGDSQREYPHSDDDDTRSDKENQDGQSRKFFKSKPTKRGNRKQYTLLNNVCAVVRKGGKLTLLHPNTKTRKRRLKSLFDDDIDFESEQMEVEDLISKMDSGGGGLKGKVEAVACNRSPRAMMEILNQEITNDEPIPIQPNVIYVPKVDEEHLYGIVGDDEAQTETCSIPGETLVTADIASAESDHAEPLQQPPVVTDEGSKLFPIFYKEHQAAVQRQSELNDEPHSMFPIARKRAKLSHGRWHADGSNQYQIDAGQKEYGAVQCGECGLVYSVHEPEEELLHENFHQSRDVLRFAGWSNERVVAQVPEWDVSGRIVAISQADSKHKLAKIHDILAVVDREMGYAESLELPDGAKVYLAVARSTVLGICVAHPLQQANRMLTFDGLAGVAIDCCSSEWYPARCGISRIWVSPNYRGNGIAHNLITVLRSQFIHGYLMDVDEIAFSTPTESGKALAEAITGRKDFLVYL